jgi:hypothetical protein
VILCATVTLNSLAGSISQDHGEVGDDCLAQLAWTGITPERFTEITRAADEAGYSTTG